MNRQYLGHDYFTDVITFDYSDRRGTRTVAGDIFIDVETVADNARIYGATTLQEMRRVVVHGLLHLCDSATRRRAPSGRCTARRTNTSDSGDPAKVTPPTVRVPPRPTGRPSARPARDIRDSEHENRQDMTLDYDILVIAAATPAAKPLRRRRAWVRARCS